MSQGRRVTLTFGSRELDWLWTVYCRGSDEIDVEVTENEARYEYPSDVRNSVRRKLVTAWRETQDE